MVSIILYNLLGVYAVQLVFALVQAAAVGAILRRPKDAHMYVCVVERGNLDFAEEVQAVRRVCDADGFEVGGGEGDEVGVGDVFYCAEVLWFVLCGSC